MDPPLEEHPIYNAPMLGEHPASEGNFGPRPASHLQRQRWAIKDNEQKARRRLNIICGIFVCVFLVILAVQALIRISSGDFIWGKNYYGQPVGPVLQLIVVLACLIVIGIAVWRHWHKSSEQLKKSNGRQQPDWMK